MKKLSQKLIKLLNKKKLKISFVESCTGGLLSSSITSISGSSKVFTLAFVTYSNQSKIKMSSEVKNQCSNLLIKPVESKQDLDVKWALYLIGNDARYLEMI